MVEVAEALRDAAEVFEASVDGFDWPVGDADVEVGEDVGAPGLTFITDSDILDFACCDLRV
ncbi:hypothetical protein GCM10023217_34790 [Gordonia alkaliphila]|uniref:Uncharacterized protein n=1 Tax=Gordonia alkaliphila TaxID=1053547 RepID=A0ABP8ZLN0_9ACTN